MPYVNSDRCAVPGFQDDKYHPINASHAALIQQYVPRDQHGTLDQCKLYSDVNVSLIPNDVIITSILNIDNVTSLAGTGASQENNTDAAVRGTKTCDRWVFDDSEFSSTIAMDVS